MSDMKQLYAARLNQGAMTPDPAQAEAVERLDRLGRMDALCDRAGGVRAKHRAAV